MSFYKIQNNNVINWRILILIIFFFFLFFLLLIRMIYLQVFQNSYFEDMSYKNSFKEYKIIPDRGIIMDRNGVIIANNTTRYDLWLQPQNINNFNVNKKESVDILFKQLSSILSINNIDLKINKIIYSNPYEKILIKKNITQDELSNIIKNKDYLPKLDIKAIKIRNYPFKGINSALLGYVGNTINKDLQKEYVVKDSLVGKTGLEYMFDKELYGEYGIERAVLNSSRKQVDISKTKRSVDGFNIKTTIDIDLQKIAVSELGNFKGSVIAMNPENGDVLSIVSTPIYDPNIFATGISQNDYNTLLSSGSLFNRAIHGQYPPASTIKPFIALSFLDGQYVTESEKVYCGPYWQLPGKSQLYRDWKKTGHGNINVQQSIEQSADVFFYKKSYESGFDYISDYIKVFGFGQKTNIALPYERSGILPSSNWKLKNRNEYWYDGETLVNSIGQGYMLTTPIQLAYATGALINGGNLFEPNYIFDSKPKIRRKIHFNKDNLKVVLNGMKDVVYGESGTATRIGKISDFTIAGKTGTAQVFSTKGRIYKDEEIKDHMKDHALFIAYAPIENPKIVVSVIVEHGEKGSTVAAPIAQKIIDSYLNKNYPEFNKNKEVKENNE